MLALMLGRGAKRQQPDLHMQSCALKHQALVSLSQATAVQIIHSQARPHLQSYW